MTIGGRRYLIKDRNRNTDAATVERKLEEKFPGHRWRVVTLYEYDDGRLRWYEAAQNDDEEVLELRKKIVLDIIEGSVSLEVIVSPS